MWSCLGPRVITACWLQTFSLVRVVIFLQLLWVNPHSRDSCELTGYLSSLSVWIPNSLVCPKRRWRQPSFLLALWHGPTRTHATYSFLWDKTNRAHCRHRKHAAATPPSSCLQQCQVSDAVKALKPPSCMKVTNTNSHTFHQEDWSRQVRQWSVLRCRDGRSLERQGKWGFTRGEEGMTYLFSKFVRLRRQPVKTLKDTQRWGLVQSQQSYKQQKPHEKRCPMSALWASLEDLKGFQDERNSRQIKGSGRKHHCSSRQPFAQRAECRQNEGQTGDREEGSPDIGPRIVRSSLTGKDQSCKAPRPCITPLGLLFQRELCDRLPTPSMLMDLNVTAEECSESKASTRDEGRGGHFGDDY